MTPPNKLKVKDEIKLREKLTNTTYFLLPIFKVPLMKLDEYGFVNAYLYDKDRIDIELEGKNIYLLFQPNENQKVGLQKQIEDWEAKGLFLTDYDYPDGYVVVVLKFPNKYMNQFKIFLDGQYSKLSKEYQDEIPRKLTLVLPSTGEFYESDSLQFMVINRRTKLKNYWKDQLDVDLTPDMEYWSKPVVELETLNIDVIAADRKFKDEKK